LHAPGQRARRGVVAARLALRACVAAAALAAAAASGGRGGGGDVVHGRGGGGAAGHTCVHDEIMSSLGRAHGGHRARHNATVSRQTYAGSRVDRHGRELQTTFAPVRIVVDTSRLAMGA